MESITPEQELQQVEKELAQTKLDATIANNAISRNDLGRAEKELVKEEYRQLSERIGKLKLHKRDVLERLKAKQLEAAANREDVKLRLFSLLFVGPNPGDTSVKYFVTPLNALQVALLCEETFGADKPLISSFFAVSPEEVTTIPKEWYSLQEEE